jgi:hypothetical protein
VNFLSKGKLVAEKETSRKYALKQGNRVGVCFIKYDIQGVFLKYAEILPTRLWDNVED